MFMNSEQKSSHSRRHLLHYYFSSRAALPRIRLCNYMTGVPFASVCRQDIMIGPLLQTGSILTEATVQFILIMVCLDFSKIPHKRIVCKYMIYFDLP